MARVPDHAVNALVRPGWPRPVPRQGVVRVPAPREPEGPEHRCIRPAWALAAEGSTCICPGCRVRYVRTKKGWRYA